MFTNNTRFDLSPYLIHFFRDINLNASDAPPLSGYFGYGNVSEDHHVPALFLLRCAIRHNRITPGWAYRNGVRTIYGIDSAVCFTEMPLGAFIETGIARKNRGGLISQFAIVLPKKTLFSLGGNPVIYGLDNRHAYVPSGKDGEPRVLDATILPQREQYRYVSYNPTSEKPIDWTHEREWRWPFREVERESEKYKTNAEGVDMSGLDLSDPKWRGLGVIAQTSKEALWIMHDILTLIDRKVIEKDHYSYILCTEELPRLDKLLQPDEVSAAISESSLQIEQYLSISASESKSLIEIFSTLAIEIERSTPIVPKRELGGAWLWLLDHTHRLTRSLIKSDRIKVSDSGRYLVKLDEFDQNRDLRQREEMIQSLSIKLKEKFAIESDYFSVLHSNDFNSVPFYCGKLPDSKYSFYNIA